MSTPDNFSELMVAHGQDRMAILSKHLEPLKPYRMITFPHGNGFRISLFDGNKFVGTINYAQVTIFNELPPDVEKLLLEQNANGVKIFLGSVATDEPYRRRGIGTALKKLALAKVSTSNFSFIDSVQDDSVVGWTERRLPAIKQFMGELGYKADELWNGIIDGKNSWLIHYRKTQVSPRDVLQTVS